MQQWIMLRHSMWRYVRPVAWVPSLTDCDLPWLDRNQLQASYANNDTTNMARVYHVYCWCTRRSSPVVFKFMWTLSAGLFRVVTAPASEERFASLYIEYQIMYACNQRPPLIEEGFARVVVGGVDTRRSHFLDTRHASNNHVAPWAVSLDPIANHPSIHIQPCIRHSCQGTKGSILAWQARITTTTTRGCVMYVHFRSQ